MQRPRLATFVCALVISALGITPAFGVFVNSSVSAQSSPPGEPKVSVTLELRGTESTRDYAYVLRIRCVNPAGAAIDRARDFTGDFRLSAAEARAFGTAEFPTLTTDSSCTVSSTDSNGAPVSYATTARARTDGSRPDPRPGVISADGFTSAPAFASGEKVTVRISFTGDLAIVERVVGSPPASNARYDTTVACRNSGYVSAVSLADGQLQILTGIPAGSECVASQSGPAAGAVRFEDNSGNPGDATVTITGTRSDCWDLRNASPACRATLVVTNRSDNRFTETTSPADQTPSTTTPDQTQPAKTSAPAVSPAPAVAVEATPAFSG
jgi:Domain of unknown function (DUF5979)